jgi:fructoselysine-6-phosphate deglycase
MLNFDTERFRSIQAGALSLAEPLHETLGELIDGGATYLFFAGAGGAGRLMQPAVDLLSQRSRFPASLVRPAEIMATDHPALDENAIVVIPSLSGTTPESQEVLRYSQERGAKVIALTGHQDTPIAESADFAFTNYAADDTSSESFYLQSLLIALSTMELHDGVPGRARTLEQLRHLPELMIELKHAFEPRAQALAEQLAPESFHIITSSGLSWAEAWYYGTCILEEMQWIRTRPIHAADFFHGTLELLDADVSLLIFKGEDASRALTDRVESFASTISQKITIIDTAVFELPGIAADVRALISPVLLATVLERLSAHIEVVRDHPLTTRRYYRQMAY